MISASIVLYKHNFNEIKTLINSIIETGIVSRLFIMDNSPQNTIQSELQYIPKIEYFFVGSNKGFGSAHNIAICKSISQGYIFHIVVNPDIIIKDDTIRVLHDFMVTNPNVGMVMPKVLYPNGNIQYLPKLLPSPFDIIKRKIKRPQGLYHKFIKKYELRCYSDIIVNVPIISGCFTMLNLNAIKEIGVYDDHFFMYFEDFDLSRRMHKRYETIYYPNATVYHGYEGGANKSLKLFVIFLKSAITYFNKWGWFLDRERSKFNNEVLNNLK